MPTYVYEHQAEGPCDLGKKFEHFQSMSSEALKTCLTCKQPVKRLLGGGAGIIFKGEGFYETDYKNKK